jgi:hypothetical protein
MTPFSFPSMSLIFLLVYWMDLEICWDPLSGFGTLYTHPEPEPGWGQYQDPEPCCGQLLVVLDIFLFLCSAGAGRGVPEAAGARQRGHSQLAAHSCHQAASSLSLTLQGHSHEFICDILNSQPIHAIRQPALFLLPYRDILTSLFMTFSTRSPFMRSGSQLSFSFSYLTGTSSRVYLWHSQLTAHSCHQAASSPSLTLKWHFH